MANSGAVYEDDTASRDLESGGFSSDAARTSRSHAGEGIQDGYNIPGILLWVVGIAALGATLTAAGSGFRGWATIGAIVCVVSLLGGSGWLLLEHRRIKAKEGLSLTDQVGH
ncbi:hypothetical protein NONI108955_14240 [Nocardia ninae]|uniref:UsfY protein n=1 Tax=Nocardia ninae NBRC 108245 TaxID=1210091 RepID=A0A511M4K0_9NOCA|nr:hypothetical protein [Nocardia ninae]GEM35545.1 hypothetical protein NN4_00640 [Nocardia ninae NBRC 108245]